VNTFNDGDHFTNADICRPRFITLEINDMQTDTSYTQNITNSNHFKMQQNYPNPFNKNTTINYNLQEKAHVNLKIFNTQGQEIETLVNDHQAPGFYSVHWDGQNAGGKNVSSGIYIYKIQVNRETKNKKMLYLK
jgi:hypothetical protein